MSLPAGVMRKHPVRILIADDHAALREGLRLLIEDQNWTVCGQAANGREAVAKVQELHPDLIILDLTMPVMSGYEAIPQIRAVSPDTKVLVYTMHQIPATANQMGADAFLTKSSNPREIVVAIQQLMGLDQ